MQRLRQIVRALDMQRLIQLVRALDTFKDLKQIVRALNTWKDSYKFSEPKSHIKT